MIKFPDYWLNLPLDEILTNLTNGTTLTQHKSPPGIPVSRIETISHSIINREKVKYVREISEEQISKFSLNVGDILFSHINSDSHLGKCALFRGGPQLLHGMNLLLILSLIHI